MSKRVLHPVMLISFMLGYLFDRVQSSSQEVRMLRTQEVLRTASLGICARVVGKNKEMADVNLHTPQKQPSIAVPFNFILVCEPL